MKVWYLLSQTRNPIARRMFHFDGKIQPGEFVCFQINMLKHPLCASLLIPTWIYHERNALVLLSGIPLEIPHPLIIRAIMDIIAIQSVVNQWLHVEYKTLIMMIAMYCCIHFISIFWYKTLHWYQLKGNTVGTKRRKRKHLKTIIWKLESDSGPNQTLTLNGKKFSISTTNITQAQVHNICGELYKEL